MSISHFCSVFINASKPSKQVLVPSARGISSIFWGIFQTTISLVVVAKADKGNQGLTRWYIDGNVADGFPKTKMSAPPNKIFW